MKLQIKQYLFFFSVLGFTLNSSAQLKATNQWKAHIALGFNYPSADGFIKGTYAQSINFPTVNLGVQHMFKRTYGIKLDYGFNRFKLDEVSPEVKINYSRINIQFVFDPTRYMGFLPARIRTVLHAGPGYTFVRPLGNQKANKQSYLNGIGGLEVHYAINEKVSLFIDTAYIYGFTDLDKYEPILNGLGAFNGHVFNLTLGLAVSLSGCQFCD